MPKHLSNPVFFVIVAGCQLACQLEPFAANNAVGETETEDSSSTTTNLPNTGSDIESTASLTSSNTSFDDTSSTSTSETTEGTTESDPDASTSGNEDNESSSISETNEDDSDDLPPPDTGDDDDDDDDDDDNDDDNDDDEQPCEVGAIYTFDTDAQGWHSGKADTRSNSDSWEHGKSTAAEASGWETAIDEFYPAAESSYLASPELSFVGCKHSEVNMEIKHIHWFSDSLLQIVPGDGGIIEVSTDGGTTWEWIEPTKEGYCSESIDSSWPPVTGKKGFCYLEKNGKWRTTVIDLQPYASMEEDKFLIRFVFGSDYLLAGTGWFIDDVRINVKQKKLLKINPKKDD